MNKSKHKKSVKKQKHHASNHKTTKKQIKKGGEITLTHETSGPNITDIENANDIQSKININDLISMVTGANTAWNNAFDDIHNLLEQSDSRNPKSNDGVVINDYYIYRNIQDQFQTDNPSLYGSSQQQSFKEYNFDFLHSKHKEVSELQSQIDDLTKTVSDLTKSVTESQNNIESFKTTFGNNTKPSIVQKGKEEEDKLVKLNTLLEDNTTKLNKLTDDLKNIEWDLFYSSLEIGRHTYRKNFLNNLFFLSF